MLFNIAQLIILFILFLWASSKLTKNRIFLYSVVAVFAFLLTLEASSVYLINQPFGYQYWINFNFEDIQVYLFQFYIELACAGIFLVLVFVLLAYLVKKISAYKNCYWIKYRWTVPIFCLMLLSLPSGVFHTLLDLAKIKFAKVESVQEALAGLGINSGEYVFPDRLISAPGKNIVVISMESLERGFLSNAYSKQEIVPNLKRLSSENTFLEMKQDWGTWTAGSLYVTLTGVPPIFKNPDSGNLIFQDLKQINFTTLGQVLNKAGYDSRFLMADAEFTGTNSLMTANQFKIITNRAGENSGFFKSRNDLDLFSEAKKQISDLNSKKQPFALFISTLNSHFPRGIYDARMESLLGKKKDDFENEIDFSVAATDYLVGDFIRHLAEKGLLQNTVFYLFPDHHMMGNGSNIAKLNSLGRGLYVITNAKGDGVQRLHQKGLMQLDLPRLIIDGSDIKSNAKFLSDFKNLNLTQASSIATLNASILSSENYINSVRVKIGENFVSLARDGKDDVMESIDKNTKTVNFIFNQEMRLVTVEKSNDNFVPHDGVWPLVQPLQLTIFLKSAKPKSYYFGNYKNIGAYHRLNIGEGNFFIPEDVVIKIVQQNKLSISDLAYEKKVYTNSYELKSIEDYFEITSSNFAEIKEGGNPSKIQVGANSFPILRGINVLYWDGKQFIVKNFDTWESEDQSLALLDKIQNLQKNREKFVLVASDALQNIWKGYQTRLSSLGFPILGTLQGRAAYIAYDNGREIVEYYDPKTVSKLISFYRNEKEWLPPPLPKLNDYLKDKNRFIAHGGGAINGKTYTNSLEALDNSYSRGFRLLELDIVETSDGKYVAAHDWKYWASIADYHGDLPPSHEVFLSKKIFGSLTPLDMDKINRWFKDHPDAVLVTDKVNNPKRFSKEFLDKGRLMMELFDIKAVREGVEAGIRASMPTGDLWPDIYLNHQDLIRDKKIKFIAASRKIDKRNVAQILDSGLKIYAFHINFDSRATEKWVVCNERNIFYGIYVDNQDVLNMQECNKYNKRGIN